MAELRSDTGAMRWQVEAVDREAPVAGPIRVVTEDGREPSGRLVATTAVEWWDPRDKQFWPFIRLPALYLAAEELRALSAGVQDLVRGAAPGFAWRAGGDLVGVQVGAGPPEAGGGLVCEIGVDVGAFLAATAGTVRRPGSELALFRFPTSQAALVTFGAELEREVGALAPRPPP